MNYVWELIIKAMHQNVDEKKIHFGVFNRKTSGYMELSSVSFVSQEMLTEDMVSQVDVYPYGRFYDIFYKWTSPGEDNPQYDMYPEFDEKLADILMHYLVRVDLRAGMNRREYHIKFIEKDIRDGVFGDAAGFESFSITEKRCIAAEILNLYTTNDYMSCVKRTLNEIFPRLQILNRSGEEVIFYCGEAENEDLCKKIKLIIKLFMPVNISTAIHWEYTYGVIGESKTIKLERFII